MDDKPASNFATVLQLAAQANYHKSKAKDFQKQLEELAADLKKSPTPSEQETNDE